MDIFDLIWNYKFSFAPVIATYAIFEISTIIRRLTRIAYTPIYFTFFPLGHADELYSQYFNEDYFYEGFNQTPKEKNRVRKKIISISVFSMVFSTVLNPILAALFAAVFLDKSQFIEFFWFLAIVKFLLISKSLYSTRHISFVGNSSSFPWLALIYVIYFVAILRIVDTAYEWAAAQVTTNGVKEMLLNAVDFVIINFGIYIIMAGALGAAISYWMTDPDNIPEIEAIEDSELLPIEE
ncbi:hypothetical protein [Rhizobium sp. Leaf262]|uniref:hypothetical protein n=1 Tax=Rhizobium sp. Leaf262 TaxID=1736312 RepID=UPI0007152013|nr:hypothetical protein [Rhizobium sp. Leaf262]KQO81186.1 hypothetical protein ASF29_17205 [Rhizobium sp. Leaf262]